MKFSKKASALILALILLGSTLAGCGGEKEKTEAPASTSKEEVSESTEEEAPSDNFNETGMPIVNDPVTLSVLTMRWGDMGDSFKNNQWLLDLEDRSNVKIDWQARSSNDWDEQRGILYASGELPDIMFGNMTIRDADILANLTYFNSLEDLIEKYMPNYKNALETIPELRSISTFPDGNMYSFAKNLPARPNTRNQVVINKVWLDNLGLEIPDTYEDLADVMRAFKEQDANGNGDLNDEIPVSGEGDIHIDFFNPFGISDINETLMTMTNGEPVFWPTSENYKEALKWTHQLYAEELIDQEAFTQDNAMLTGKRVNESDPLIGIEFQWTPDAVFGKWSDQYIAIPPLKGPDGNRYAGGDENGVFSIMRNEAAITTFCEQPEVAARWIDEFYDSEASIQNFWGAIDTVITKNDDGTYSLNDPPAETSADAWYWDQSLRDFGPKYIEPGFSDKILLSKDSGDGLKLEISKISDDYIMDQFPQVIYTQEEADELATLEADIGKYILQARATFITEGGIDEGWDAYIKQLEDMDLSKLVEIRMAAYERIK